MGMNNIYYRFLHLTTNEKYKTIPARLRIYGMHAEIVTRRRAYDEYVGRAVAQGDADMTVGARGARASPTLPCAACHARGAPDPAPGRWPLRCAAGGRGWSRVLFSA